jgi:hypothetical protein
LPSQRTKVCDSASPTPAGKPIRRETCLVTAQWARNLASTVFPPVKAIPAAVRIRVAADRSEPACPSTYSICASCDGPTWYMPDRNATSSPNSWASSNDSPVQTRASKVTQ